MQPQHLLTSEKMFPNKADAGLCKQRFIYYFIYSPCLYYLFLHLLILFPSNYSMPSPALNAVSNFTKEFLLVCG